MTVTMAVVNAMPCILEEFCFSSHTIRRGRARKIINNPIRCSLPVSIECREYVVPAFGLGNAVETVSNTVCAPAYHDTTSKPLLAILVIVFRAFGTALTPRFQVFVMSEIGVVRATSYLGQTVE